MADFDPEAWAHEQAAGFDPEKWADSMADPEAPAKRTYSKGKYEPQLGQAPKGNLPPVSLGDMLKTAVVQGGTLGAADEVIAAIKTAAKGIAALHEGKNPSDAAPWDSTYRAERDSQRDVYHQAEASHPVAYPIVEAISSIPAAVMVGGPVKGWKTAARAGGIVGSLLGLNSSEAPDAGGVAADTIKSGATGAILGPLAYGATKGAGALGLRLSKTGTMNTALDTLAQHEGIPNTNVADVQKIVGEGGRVPLQAVENPANRVTLQKMFRQPKISRLSGEGDAAMRGAVSEADAANAAAGQRLNEAEVGLETERQAARNTLRNSRNAQREAVQQTAAGNEAAAAENRAANQAKVEGYNQQVESQNQAYANERQAYEADRAAKAQEYTSSVEEYNAQRAEEASSRRAALNETSAQRQARAERAVNARNEYTQAKEDQYYAIKEGKQARNQAIQEIRKGDPKLDKQLEKAPRYNLRKLIERRVPADDPKLRDLNDSWNELEMAREPVPRPRAEPPVASPPLDTEVTPRPTRAADGPRPVPPARPARPTPSARPKRDIAPAYNEPPTPGYDAARQERLAAKQNVASVADSTQHVYDAAASLEKSMNRIHGAKNSLSDLISPTKNLKRVLGKQYFDNRAVKKILSNDETYNYFMDLAAKGERIKPGTPEADHWAAALTAFMQTYLAK